MNLKIGIVGLPNVGKSTTFNALTRSKSAKAANFPFCTIDPNIGVVEVPDQRINKLAELVHPQKIIPAVIEFVDIAGLVKGASHGEGLGNQFLSHIRESDAIAQIVRFFHDPDVIHVHHKIDPKNDIETIEAELILADLQTMEKRLHKVRSDAKSGDKKLAELLTLLESLDNSLKKGIRVAKISLSDGERALIRDLHLLTAKPMLYIANLTESEMRHFDLEKSKKELEISDALIPICAKLEEELAELPPDEARELLKEYGLFESGLDEVIKIAYNLLSLQTFFTAGEKEVRAWTIRKGATAPEAAGVIHTDFQKGFIKAEVIAYEDYIKSQGESSAREKGLLRQEGKEYIVKDGDVMHFRFNV